MLRNILSETFFRNSFSFAFPNHRFRNLVFAVSVRQLSNGQQMVHSPNLKYRQRVRPSHPNDVGQSRRGFAVRLRLFREMPIVAIVVRIVVVPRIRRAWRSPARVSPHLDAATIAQTRRGIIRRLRVKQRRERRQRRRGNDARHVDDDDDDDAKTTACANEREWGRVVRFEKERFCAVRRARSFL